jgi:predicted phosphodiesterase
MKVLILSDVHGNLPALELVLKINFDVDLIVSLGDVVNYGPWSNECVELLDTLDNVILLSGNHEKAYLNGYYDGKNPIAKVFFEHCYPSFTKHNLISNYLEDYYINQSKFTHTLEGRYIYPDSEINLINDIFIGHSHRLFLKYSNGYRLINVGSVGQNRLNINDINYVIWNSKSDSLSLCTNKIDSNIILNEMKNRKYPEMCINYLTSKL